MAVALVVVVVKAAQKKRIAKDLWVSCSVSRSSLELNRVRHVVRALAVKLVKAVKRPT